MKGNPGKRRYYCAGAEGPEGHCDDKRGYIQCDFCIWQEQEFEQWRRDGEDLRRANRKPVEHDKN